jgi:histidine triad (HIT) family protein
MYIYAPHNYTCPLCIAHYHLHIFPKYPNDELHKHILNKKITTPEERLPYAKKIKQELEKKEAK